MNSYSQLTNYELNQLPIHLVEGDMLDDLFTIVNPAFGEALRERNRSDFQFSTHLLRARNVAFTQGSKWISEAIRLLCIDAGLRSRADSVWPTTLMLMAGVGQIDRALYTAALIRDWGLRVTSFVLVLRAMTEPQTQITMAQVDRAREFCNPLLGGSAAGPICVALANAFLKVGSASKAREVLVLGRRVITTEVEHSIRPPHLAEIAKAFLKLGNCDDALETLEMDKIRASAMPLLVEIVGHAKLHANSCQVTRCLQIASETPEWVGSGHGLDADDLFALSREALGLDLPDLAASLRAKAEEVAAKSLGVRGLVAKAVDCSRLGNRSAADRLFRKAERKAAAKWEAFSTEAWLDIAKAADAVGNGALGDRAIAKARAALAGESLYSAADHIRVIANFHIAAGRPSLAAETIIQAIGPIDNVRSYDVPEWIDLAVLAAETASENPSAALDILVKQLVGVGIQYAMMAKVGLAFVRNGDTSAGQAVLDNIESAKAPAVDDPGLALLHALLAYEIRLHEMPSRQELERSSPRSFASVGDSDPRSLRYIEKIILDKSGVLRDIPDRWHETLLIQFVPAPPLLTGENPKAKLRSVLEEQQVASPVDQGGSSQNRAEALCACAGAFLNNDEIIAAFQAVKSIEFWRMMNYIHIAPMDAEDFGTHECLLRTAALHAGALVAIVTASTHGAREQVPLSYEDVLEELRNNPHESVRFAARRAIISRLTLEAGHTVRLIGEDLEASLDVGRTEVLATIAAWLPKLNSLFGLPVMRTLEGAVGLVGEAFSRPDIPSIMPKTPRGAQFRTYELSH